MKVFFKSVISILVSLFVFTLPGAAQSNSDVVLILPFENTSGKSEFNWVGESFADSLTDLLKGRGITVVANEERKSIQQKLNVPLSTLPSLATSLKLSREAKSNLLVLGKYDLTPAQGEVAAIIKVTARIVRVNEGAFLTEDLPDGRKIIRDITLQDALGNMQTVQGQLAYQILYKRDKNLMIYSQRDFVEQANKVPPQAFEAYIKGLLTSPDDPRREGFLKNALRLFTENKGGGVYSEAALELGHHYYNRKDYQNALEYFSRVPAQDPQYAEAAYYSGSILLAKGDYEPALAIFRPLANDLKLISLYNTLGAVSLLASQQNKKDKAKSASFINEGLDYLKKAIDSSPKDSSIKFNYGYGLFLSQDFPGAVESLRPVLAANQRDGETYFLLSKALETIKGKEDEAVKEFDNQAKRFLVDNNRYAKFESEWKAAKTVGQIEPRLETPKRDNFATAILARRQNQPISNPVDDTLAFLQQARNLYKAGRDDEAVNVLTRVLTTEPMSAEAYLLLGHIRLRRGELETAVSAYRTALFWDNKLLEGHISMSRIFYERRDCQQAETFARSAQELDSENDEVIALQRLVEKCKK
jgi:tetratricopeptide (TPR) repeat protein